MPDRKKFVITFKDKLVKMIKDANGKFDDYFSASPKTRQILLHQGYELVIISLIDKDYCKKQNIYIVTVVVTKKLLNIILLTKRLYKKIKKISIITCLKKEKMQKKNMEQIKIQVIWRNQIYFSSSNVSTDTTVIVKD